MHANIIGSSFVNPLVTESIQQNLLIGMQVIKKNVPIEKIERRKPEVANRRKNNLFFFCRSTCHLIHSKELAHFNAGHKDECVARNNRKKKTESSKQKNDNNIEAVD